MSKFGKRPTKEWFDNHYKDSDYRYLRKMAKEYIIHSSRDDDKLVKLDSAEFRGLIYSLYTGNFSVNGFSIKPFTTYFMTGSSDGFEMDIANYLPYDLSEFISMVESIEEKNEQTIDFLLSKIIDIDKEPNVYCNLYHLKGNVYKFMERNPIPSSPNMTANDVDFYINIETMEYYLYMNCKADNSINKLIELNEEQKKIIESKISYLLLGAYHFNYKAINQQGKSLFSRRNKFEINADGRKCYIDGYKDYHRGCKTKSHLIVEEYDMDDIDKKILSIFKLGVED